MEGYDAAKSEGTGRERERRVAMAMKAVDVPTSRMGMVSVALPCGRGPLLLDGKASRDLTQTRGHTERAHRQA
jgi:hypothetical protein